MYKKFIDQVKLVSKELKELNVNRKLDRPHHLSMLGNILIAAEKSDKKSYEAGEIFPVSVEVKIKMYDPGAIPDDEKLDISSFEDYCFMCCCKVEMILSFMQQSSYEKDILPQFSEGIVSLVYDDIRIMIEDSINRTSYRGFYLPVDFRDIVAKDVVA